MNANEIIERDSSFNLKQLENVAFQEEITALNALWMLREEFVDLLAVVLRSQRLYQIMTLAVI